MIDGASRVGFFWRILLPLSGPGLVTVGVLAFVASWNAYLLPLLMLGSPKTCDPARSACSTSRRVLAGHRRRARLHLARDDARARLLHARRAADRRRPHRRGQGIATLTIDDDPTAPLRRDPARTTADRVDALIAALTLEEKVAQLYGVWVGAGDDGGEVAPHQHDSRRRRRPRRRPAARARAAHPAVRHGARSTPRSARCRSAHPAADRRGEPPRHPGDRARGVPGRLRRLGRDRLPGARWRGARPSTRS